MAEDNLDNRELEAADVDEFVARNQQRTWLQKSRDHNEAFIRPDDRIQIVKGNARNAMITIWRDGIAQPKQYSAHFTTNEGSDSRGALRYIDDEIDWKFVLTSGKNPKGQRTMRDLLVYRSLDPKKIPSSGSSDDDGD